MTTEMIAQVTSIVLNAVLAILALISAKIVIPWVKTTVIPWLKEKHLYSIVVQLVKAAEKLAESEQIERCQKKNYVVTMLEGKGVDVNADVVAMIESAVTDLDIAFSADVVGYEDEFEFSFDDFDEEADDVEPEEECDNATECETTEAE